MPNFHFERDAIERVLARLERETPPWRRARPHTQLAAQAADYQLAAERIRFLGVSRPNLAAATDRNVVAVFVPWTKDDPIDPVPAERPWTDAVIVRPPTEAELALCGFRDSAVLVAEAIDVISGEPGDAFRPLGVKELFVAI